MDLNVSPGARLLAYVLDNVILTVPIVVMMVGGLIGLYFLGVSQGWTPEATGSFGGALVAVVLLAALVLNVVYFWLFEGSSYMGTPGKLLLGLRVVKEDGSPLSSREAFFRAMVKTMGMQAFFLVGALVMLDRDRRGVWDMVVRSRVVRRPPQA